MLIFRPEFFSPAGTIPTQQYSPSWKNSNLVLNAFVTKISASNTVNQSWSAFLHDSYAMSVPDSNAVTACPLDEPRHFVSALLHLDQLHVAGKDAEKFLQSILSNDIGSLDPDTTQWSTVCNPKGRVVALLLVIKRSTESFHLIVHQSLLATVSKKLQLYKLRSRVEISEERERVIVGISPAGELTTLPADARLYRLPNDDQRGLCLFDSMGSALKGWRSFAKTMAIDNFAAWLLEDVHYGIFNPPLRASEKHLPQSLNLDLRQAISYSKGCYPGQEIIARLHYLGENKKRLLSARLTANEEVLPGDSVFLGDKAVGEVLSVISNKDENILQWVANDMRVIEDGGLRASDSQGPELRGIELNKA